ncbi:sulfurtransferase [Deinococcus sp.]|uniref:sulfurtransferase n=1 Tax=Deinococcus sp. TaxID=47478 RepID=UPI0025BBD909|nr:sulfurtransferase [Deinococcus sp.]
MIPAPLKSAQWLTEQLQNQQLRVLDCRYNMSDPLIGRVAYMQGHVPGAAYADLETDLSAPVRPDGAGGRHPLPDPQALAKWLGSLGIGNDSVVVCYDDPTGGQGYYAARAWWLLRWLGHREVYVLDGGWPMYLAAGGAVSTDEAVPTPTTFKADVQTDLLATAADVQRRGPDVLLIDSRAPQRYAGATEPLDKKAGHITGAVNRNWADAQHPEGTFKPAAAQAARLAAGDRPTVTYCGSGVSATTNLMARELAGVPLGPQNRLYAGSWSDWISDDSREIATGME